MENKHLHIEEESLAEPSTKLVNTEIHDVHGIVVSGGTNDIHITINDGNVAAEVKKKESAKNEKSFADYILDPSQREALLEKYRTIVPGTKGKDLMLRMHCGVKVGQLSCEPPHAVLEREFGEIGSRQSYEQYRDISFTDKEMTPIMEYLNR